MIQLSPEQLIALQIVVGDTAAQMSAVLDISIDRAEAYLERVTRFIRSNGRLIENMRFAIILVPGLEGKDALDHKLLLSLIRTGKRVLYIDEELRLVRSVEGGVRHLDCCQRTRDEQSFCMRVDGSYSHEILCGQHINEIDVCSPGSEEPAVSRWYRKMIDFELIAKDHFETWITRQQSERHWADRRKRILSVGTDGTENIFHQSLFMWLKMFVIDKIKIYAEPTTMGQDKTDVIVVTIEGAYVIEVKWLGKNENRQSYDEERIDEGLIQVGLYLDNDSGLVCGHLVIYDGRDYDKHKTASGYTKSRQHSLCQDPLIFWLASETPSETGPRVVGGKNA